MFLDETYMRVSFTKAVLIESYSKNNYLKKSVIHIPQLYRFRPEFIQKIFIILNNKIITIL